MTGSLAPVQKETVFYISGGEGIEMIEFLIQNCLSAIKCHPEEFPEKDLGQATG